MSGDLQVSDGLAWREWGEGRAIVLLHGIGSGSEGYRNLATQFASRRVIAWDMPGYGRSSALEADWPDADDYASRLLKLFDRLDPERPMLMGHSLGALIAGHFARLHPHRVGQLVLASPALGHRIEPPALSRAVEDRLAAFEAEGPEGFAAARAPKLLARPQGPALAAVRDQMARLDTAGHRAAARLLSAGDLLADVADLDVPTDVIVGEKDRITPPDTARRLHSALQAPIRGRLTLIPDAGHALAAEAPEALAAALSLTEIS